MTVYILVGWWDTTKEFLGIYSNIEDAQADGRYYVYNGQYEDFDIIERSVYDSRRY